MMGSRAESGWRRAAVRTRALAFGILTAIALVTAYTYVCGWLAARAANDDGSHLLVPLDAQTGIAALFAAGYALIAAMLCAPLWLMIARRGRDSAPLAAILGFLVVTILWIVDNLNATSSLPDVIAAGLPYAICGAISGLATWWAGPRHESADQARTVASL